MQAARSLFSDPRLLGALDRDHAQRPQVFPARGRVECVKTTTSCNVRLRDVQVAARSGRACGPQLSGELDRSAARGTRR